MDRSIIFGVLEFRLGYPPHKWRNVYKALCVLEHLMKLGPEDCVRRGREDFAPKLASLATGFAYTAPDGKDVGANVRGRAAAIGALLSAPGRLEAERAAAAAREGRRFVGYGRHDAPPPAAAAPAPAAPESPPAHLLPNAGETKGEGGLRLLSISPHFFA